MRWSLTITQGQHQELHEWLVRPDGDEHAAFLLCGLVRVGSAGRLLVRRVVPVADDDFTLDPSRSHYRIAGSAVARAGRLASDAGLAVVWAHSHPLQDVASLSPQDLDTHRPAAQALGAITGLPVGALVLGVAGGTGIISPNPRDPQASVQALSSIRVIGHHVRDLEGPSVAATSASAGDRFARQILLFGPLGQALLRGLKVGVIGLGGGGSLLSQMLAHLGVGTILLLDFDHVDESNLSRIVGSTAADAVRGTPKIDVAERLIASVDPHIQVIRSSGDLRYQDDARGLIDCDFLFLATDTLFARFAFNVLCHQYLIPGIQVGAKVSFVPGSAPVVHVASRPVGPGIGCLTCAGAIPPDQLREEQLSDEERRAQRYIDAPTGEPIAEASVINLNSIATAMAVTDFLLMFIGLLSQANSLDGLVFYPVERSLRHRSVESKPGCFVCDRDLATSSYARGDTWPLPLRPGRASTLKPAEQVERGSGRRLSRVVEWLRRRL